MKTLTTITSVLLLLLAANMSHAQESRKNKKISVYGRVYDSFTKGYLNAHVTLMRSDSTVIDTTTCEKTKTSAMSYYEFRLPLDNGNYIVKATAEGYHTASAIFRLERKGRKDYFEAPDIFLRRKAHETGKEVMLDEVEVRGTRVQITYRGDTIVYDAAAFKLPEGSMLDALVKQLPGAEITDNGDIYINGEKIDYLTLNGKDFFKKDNKVMLDNLPYYTVKNLKVYHRSTEQSQLVGRNVERKEHVMDVALKREFMGTYLGNAEAGGGSEERWMARAFGMRNSDLTNVVAYANMNNVNEDRRPGGNGKWDPKKSTNGVKTTRQAGVGIQTEDKAHNIKNMLDVRGSWDGVSRIQTTERIRYNTDGNILTGEMARAKQRAGGIELNNRLMIRKWRTGLSTVFNIDDRTREASSSDSTISMAVQTERRTEFAQAMLRCSQPSTKSASLTNRSRKLSQAQTRNVHLYQSAYTSIPFKSGDMLAFNASLNYMNMRPSEGFTNSRTEYIAIDSAETRQQYAKNTEEMLMLEGKAGYTVQLPEQFQLQLSADYASRKEHSTRGDYRLDLIENQEFDNPGWLPRQDMLEETLDKENSERYHTTKDIYGAGIDLYKFTKKMNFMLNIPFRYVKERMDYTHSTCDTVARRSYKEMRTYLSIKTFGKNPLNFSYNFYTLQPGFERLMPVRDTSNPLLTVIRNPNLKTQKKHDFEAQATFKNDSTGSSVYVRMRSSLSPGEIRRRMTYNSLTGAYTSMQDNVNGNWNMEVKSGWQRPLDRKRRLRMDINASVSYDRDVDFAETTDIAESGVLSKVDNWKTYISAKLSYRLSNFSCGVAGYLTARSTRGSLETTSPIDAQDWQYGANLTYTIPWIKTTIATDINMFTKRGYDSNVMNTDEVVWNILLTRNFWKGRLTAKLQAYDILQQLTTRKFYVDGQGRTVTWNNSIPRYVMLSVAVNMAKKKGK
ncbi:MAG: TonB-dependent receptor [Prevotella sp.]